MKGADLARVRRAAAQRALAPGDTAAARATRGRALVDAALRGEPLPEPPTDPAPSRAAVRVELTACARCYRPHEAPPGTVCASCADPPPPDLSDV